MNYKYKLETGSKHIICPNCGKKTFKCYVNANTGERVNPDKFGRCERISACRYHRYPKLEAWEKDEFINWTPPPLQPPKPIEYVSPTLVESTFRNFRENVFFLYLVKTFGRETAFELQSKYNIGTATRGGTIFWQQDNELKFRTGKVMYYQQNGKRDKDRKSWFIHSKIRPDFNYRQCFFGLHLIDGTKPVALCESEKTAVLMSVYQPEFTWIACGGSEMLNAQRIYELKRLDKVFPDNGQFDKWEQRTKMFNRQMDVSVDKAVESGILPAGSDILDLIQLKL